MKCAFHSACSQVPWRLKILRLNAELYPQAGEYESLAEAYAFADDRAHALAEYQRAAQLDPSDATAIEMVRRLSMAAAP